ncbi:MAG TPA: prepilin-type N-terminal cleavage/methylation domain-containing protein [Candidatus Paceibacterota bacterium]|nr:prepilin-type N-terminal cleavage/methylation domain-containing protein [Candidatus Paceibacterota bacterium]
MKKSVQIIGNRLQAKCKNAFSQLLQPTAHCLPPASSGMTLVETLVAVSILAVSIVAPMTLTMQSLAAAYYARDQVIASNLAQEAIEAVRAIRDANILTLALNAGATCPSDGQPMHLLCSIPIDQDFIIDARIDPPAITPCAGECPKLKTDNNLYGHDPTWTIETPFRRVVRAEYVSGAQDEIRISVTVTRVEGLHAAPPVVLQENLYRWVNDGTSE